MLPSFLGILVIGLGLVLIYVGLYGGGFLTVYPKSMYEAGGPGGGSGGSRVM